MLLRQILLTGRAVKVSNMIAGVVVVEPDNRLHTALNIESWPRRDTIISIIRLSKRGSF